MSDISGLDTRMRMPGLATGMDTDAMIKKMMAAENIKMDKMKQNRQYVQWRQDIYRDIIKDFRDLRSSFLMTNSPADTNVIMSGAYSGSTITVTDDKNVSSSNITATALPGAANGTSTIKVTQIAKSARIDGKGLNLSSKITDLTSFRKASLDFGEGGSITLSDVNFGNMDDLVKDINNQINSPGSKLIGKISVSKETIDGENYLRFNQITNDNITLAGAKKSDGTDIGELSGIISKALNPKSNNTLKSLGINGDVTFTIQQGSKVSEKITIGKDKTIQDLIKAINDAKSNGSSSSSSSLYSDLQVSYSDLTKSLSIQTRNTGSNQSLQIICDPSTNSDDFNKLGLSTSLKQGQDAIVEITPPGSTIATTVTESSNNFTIDNVNYNLVKDPNGKPYDVTLTTKADSQGSFNKIKAFIDKYNALVQKISDKIQEKKEYSYKPLTDDQKKDMKEDQIKSWEDKAKKGILKNDGELQSILFSMRNAFTTGVQEAGISLQEIGIDTYGSFEAATKPGQLKIDETKLKSALETRGDQVMKIFITPPPSTVPDTPPAGYDASDSNWKDKYKLDNSGIFQRISSIINNAAVKFDGTLLKKAGYLGTISESDNTISKQLKEQDKSISEMNKKLATKQERYYQMFARLETAMNQMNAQQSWLTQQLSGGR